MRSHDRLLVVGVRDAEMIKYAANTMLAMKISFMNEIAQLCEHYGIDVELVRRGIGSDSRIGYSFIYPGCGYGGSCLPKDVRALVQMGREAGVSMEIVEKVDKRNTLQKLRLIEKIAARFGESLAGKTFALWGLSFKPDTDDVREAPSLSLSEGLIRAGANVTAYDPVASDSFRDACGEQWLRQGRLSLAKDQYEALSGASALVLVTEWKQFRNPDFDRMKRALKEPVVFDGRNQYNPRELRNLGFEYFGIGR
jgi:UDPglucose 6-dehydrogenase